jgi:hypothetical protein
MEDLNQFPALSSLRPQHKFLGVQVPAMDENFHGWAESTTRNALVALEVLGEQKTENRDYVFVFYEDNVVRRVSTNSTQAPSQGSAMQSINQVGLYQRPADPTALGLGCRARTQPQFPSFLFGIFFFITAAHARQAPARRFISLHRTVWDAYRKSFFLFNMSRHGWAARP